MPDRWKQAARERQERTGLTYSQALDAEIAFPEAAPGQAAFEAQLMRRIGYGLRSEENGSTSQRAFGIRGVSATRKELSITLDSRLALIAFACAVAPVLYPERDGVDGVPGLRVACSDRGLKLHRGTLPGSVVLVDVDAAQWAEALEQGYDPDHLHRSTYLGDRAGLHFLEARELSTSPFVNPRPHESIRFSLISGILRRPHVFHCDSWMRFTDLWFGLGRDADINIEWAGDLSYHDVVSRLTDPRLGLPLRWRDALSCRCEPCVNRKYAVDLRHVRDSSVRIWLTHSDMYDDEFPRSMPRPCQNATR